MLTDSFSSPGISTERIRIFLARGVALVPESERTYVPEHEEAHLEVAWVPLDEAVAGILAGDLHNGVTALGILAAYAAQSGRFRHAAGGGCPGALTGVRRRAPGPARQWGRAGHVTRKDWQS